MPRGRRNIEEYDVMSYDKDIDYNLVNSTRRSYEDSFDIRELDSGISEAVEEYAEESDYYYS